MRYRIRHAGPLSGLLLRSLRMAGVTSPWRTIYLLPEHDTAWMRAHERAHIAQIDRDGAWYFWPRIVFEYLRHGYSRSPYEIEARAIERRYYPKERVMNNDRYKQVGSIMVLNPDYKAPPPPIPATEMEVAVAKSFPNGLTIPIDPHDNQSHHIQRAKLFLKNLTEHGFEVRAAETAPFTPALMGIDPGSQEYTSWQCQDCGNWHQVKAGEPMKCQRLE